MSKVISRLFARKLWNKPGKKLAARSSRAANSSRLSRALETLETRLTPTGLLVSFVTSGTSNTRIEGSIFVDGNSNGVKDAGEDDAAGWRVYLDLDASGTWNTDAVGATEPSALTGSNGTFSLKNLQPGNYRLSEIVPAGWTPTTPVTKDLVITNNKTTNATFGNFAGGGIQGTVWNDVNHDGLRAKESVTGAYTDLGLAGWTVFLDINDNKALDPTEPKTLTDADGLYSFSNLPPGDYEVTEVQPPNWTSSPTYDKRQTVTVQGLKVATQDYANFSLLNGTLRGVVWNDLNGDGNRAVDLTTGLFTDPGLSGWIVFVDQNLNGVADPAEQTAVTNDAGEYAFASVLEGSYNLVEVLPSSSWYVSSTGGDTQLVNVTAGELTVADDFSNFTILNGSIRGTVWNDLSRNGIRDTNISGAFTDPGLANWTVFLDRNFNMSLDASEPFTLTDANGSYTFADLQVGDYEVREIVPTGWETTTAYDSGYTVTVFSGTESVAHDFANFNIASAVAGSLSGTTWNDLTGNGVRDFNATTGTFTDPGVGGRVVFADLNGNGVLDATEPNATSAADGSYTISGVLPGTVTIVEQAKSGWSYTSPLSGTRTIALKNAENATGLDFGSHGIQGSAIHGTVFSDTNKNGTRQAGEKGLAGITVYLDLNGNGALDASEPQMVTSADQFYTPAVDEAGTYGFTHLTDGTYTVRFILPATLSGTPTAQLSQTVTLGFSEDHTGADCAAQYRANEIHGVRFDDANGNHLHDPGEVGVGGKTIYIDIDRDDIHDAGEPTTVTGSDGSYTFTGLAPGAYVVREDDDPGYEHTYPTTTGGILWPTGVSNPAVGNVSPTSITVSLTPGQSYSQTCSLTLPLTGQLTNMVDVFLLFDDTGSFVSNSPIVRAAFPSIISQLQSSLPGIDLGFGVGRFEEYANFAFEYSSGRPFILNQPIVAASTSGYMTAIQAALDRTAPGYGGDQPETDIEALFQLVSGLGFDGNNNGSVLDSGAAGLVSTQLSPGASGDVPSFASFKADPTGSVMAAAGNLGGGGFRAGALPIILTATDTGFAYQPYGETTVTGVGGVSVPLSALTQTSRSTTPYNYGAGFQQTITALNSLGALVIGLGTNTETNLDPRQGLSALSKLTGAVNHSTSTIANGTATPIAPGDPLYFQIASGFAGSVANGVVTAIQNAVTSVAVDIDVQASDPRVHIINHTGIRTGIGSGLTASFDIEFVGDGIPHRFDLQFVRAGTNVVLGSIPVVLGTPIAGNCYEFEDLEDGEVSTNSNFGSRLAATTTAPTINLTGGIFAFDGSPHAATATATGTGGIPVAGSFTYTYNGVSAVPTAVGIYDVIATFTSTDPSYTSGSSSTTLTIHPTVLPPTVSSVVFGDGTGQRSQVRQIVVTFSEPVNFMGGAASAFTVHRSGTGGTVGDVVLSANPTSGPANSVTITFSGGLTELGSLVDGFYDFMIDAAQVSAVGGSLLDGNNDLIPGGSYSVVGTTANKFFRLFGDDNGDATVSQVDFNAFRLVFLGGPNLEFDFDGDDQVSQVDYNAFRLRFLGTP